MEAERTARGQRENFCLARTAGMPEGVSSESEAEWDSRWLSSNSGSLRLHRDAADPTRPRPVVVISPGITSLSQKLSEHSRAATSQRSLHKSGSCAETCKEMSTLAVFPLLNFSAAARDQTTGSFGEKCETWCTEDRFTRCGRAIQVGKWCAI